MDLSESLKEKIIQTILNQKPAAKIVLFGSRARGNAKTTSDIDLAIMDGGRY